MSLRLGHNRVLNLVCLVLFVWAGYLPAQQKDSLRFYKKIKHSAYKHRLTRLAYEAVFVDPEPKEYPTQPAVPAAEKHVNPYLLYPGRIINKIHVTVLDPFGNSVNDTVSRDVNWLQRTGNNLHITTRRWIILNRLLFKEHDTVNPLAISESERMLRQAEFVNDARIYIGPTPSRDSIDVFVVVHDRWPLTVPVFVSDLSANVRIRSSNLLGLGQQFEQFIGFRKPDLMEYNGFYNIANIDRTYISSKLAYATSRNGTSVSWIFDRPFYSPLAKWAGSFVIGHAWKPFPYFDSIQDLNRQSRITYLNYDLYLAKSFKFSKSKSLFNQSTNFVIGGRYYNGIFLARPGPDIDPSHRYRNSSGVLGNVGLAIQEYYKDKYIYRFGANEDVPEGTVLQCTYGYLNQEGTPLRYYSAAEVASARHFGFGYLSISLGYGVMFNRKLLNDVTTSVRVNYFSQLLRSGRHYFRQFFYYTFIRNDHKLPWETTMLRSDEMYGFTNAALSGTSKMVLNSETVAYLPYNLVGFHFAPVLMAAAGALGNPGSPVLKNMIYQAYSLGIMFRNENLLASTFQVSFGYYPYLPDGRRNVLTYNPVTSFTLKVRPFTVTKPDVIPYN